jgi:hypothetical protein
MRLLSILLKEYYTFIRIINNFHRSIGLHNLRTLLEGKDLLGDQGVDGRILLKWIIKE